MLYIALPPVGGLSLMLRFLNVIMIIKKPFLRSEYALVSTESAAQSYLGIIKRIFVKGVKQRDM